MDNNMLFYFTECWDLFDEGDDNTMVALASIAADHDDDTVATSTVLRGHANDKDNNRRDCGQGCYEGFFDKLSDQLARIMGCDEYCICYGCRYGCACDNCTQDQVSVSSWQTI